MILHQTLFHLADSASNVIDGGLAKGCGSDCPNAKTLTTVTAPNIVNIMLYLVAALAIIMIIVGGLRYVISAGNPSAINGAKDTILYAVVGLVLASAAYAIVGFTTGQFGL